jgi:hypothetical protein
MASPKPILYVAIGAVLALLVTGMVVFYLAIWPWMAPPPASSRAIDVRWAQVQAWAVPDPGCKKDPLPISFVEAVHKNSDSYRSLIAQKTGYPRLEKAALSVEAQAALRGLEAWSKKEGGFVLPPSPAPYALPLYNLGKLALATASSLDDEAVSTVLHTAKILRRCGDLFGVAVGFGLSESLVRWLEDRGLRPDARIALLRPTRDELFAAVARETVRWHEDGRHTVILPGAHTPTYVYLFVDTERELAWLKYEGAERLFAANAFGRDPDRLAALYPQDENSLPKSTLVRGNFVFPGIFIGQAAKSIKRHDAALAAR